MAIWAGIVYIVVGCVIFGVTFTVFVLAGVANEYDDEMMATGLCLGLAWPVILLISPLLIAFLIALSLPYRKES